MREAAEREAAEMRTRAVTEIEEMRKSGHADAKVKRERAEEMLANAHQQADQII